MEIFYCWTYNNNLLYNELEGWHRFRQGCIPIRAMMKTSNVTEHKDLGVGFADGNACKSNYAYSDEINTSASAKK